MPTPHNIAEKNQIAGTVLMPGDPLRAKFIADEYLEDVLLVNNIRNMLAYTGTYQGKRITVMGSGMGMPSMGIYSYELFKFYDVDSIIRVGSSVSYSREIGLQEIIIGSGACTKSTFAREQSGFTGDFIKPSQELIERIKASADRQQINVHEGVIHSSDVFYYEAGVNSNEELHKKYQVICGEMESFALFHNANITGKQAATVLTISDTVFSKEEVSAQDRQTSFHNMIRIALGACL